MKSLLDIYLKRLTNLSGRNKSIWLKRLTKAYFFDFHRLDGEQNTSSYKLLDKVFFANKAIPICRVLDPRDAKSNLLSKYLLQIFRTDKLIQAERGAHDLQLGFPVVEGKFRNGNTVRAPLLFFPVTLYSKENNWFLERTGNPEFNTSFLLAYEQFNGVHIDKEIIEYVYEEKEPNLEKLILDLYEKVKGSALNLNFNRELFEKELYSVKSHSIADTDDWSHGELKLQSQSILGIFPQAGSFIAQDYKVLQQQESHDSLEAYFDPVSSSKVVREKDLNLPLPCDQHQEGVIRSVLDGKSLVVQGPPGSGKSQLITNLMADFAAKGKKVLLVCQKRAALDTVYKRLKEIELGSFAGLVHDFKSDRKKLYDQLNAQIAAIPQYKSENLTLDAIFLERSFDKLSLEIDQICDFLKSYKQALFDESAFGISAKTLYLKPSYKSAYEAYKVVLPQAYSYSDALGFFEKIKSLEAYEEHFYGVYSYTFFEKRKNSQHWSLADLEIFKNALAEVYRLESLFETYEMLSFNGYQKASLLHRSISTFDNSFARVFEFNVEEKIKTLNSAVKQYAKHKAVFDSLRKEDLGVLRGVIQKALDLKHRPLQYKWFQLTSKEWKKITPWLKAGNLTLLYEHIEFLKHFEYLEKFWGSNGYKAIKAQVLELLELLRVKKQMGFKKWEDFEFWSNLLSSRRKLCDKLQSYLELKDLTFVKQYEHETLSDFATEQWEQFQAYDKIFITLNDFEKQLWNSLKDASFIEHALHSSFLEAIESKNPILKAVSTLEMSQQEKGLQSKILQKQELSIRNLGIKLKENTYRHVEKNRLGNVTSYRELKHQVSKKKRIWPIRKLLGSFGEEIFRLMPCWLASPETVSAIFPMVACFDLIIFDEASQCYAEQGLPAMLRGKQVVVAGDEQQLQPTDIYNIKYEQEEEEGDYLAELDSLLALASSFLPNTMLLGHYRSSSLPLIEFSNQHFYKGKLALIPHRDKIGSSSSVVQYENVKGVWYKNTNLAEAIRVVELVEQAQASYKTVGVVTFNVAQAKLIKDLLGSSTAEVKNIENIQGDEYDALIFSIAYAPDKTGKLRVQFGSLSKQGGENRLNVAITRAREQVNIVCSLEPEDLQVDKVLNAGPKLLKKYLAYARDVSKGRANHFQRTEDNLAVGASLKEFMQAKKPNYHDDLPFADLVEREGGDIKRLILTDDNRYFQSMSAKGYHGYFPLTLKSKAWKYKQVWSRQYWTNSSSKRS